MFKRKLRNGMLSFSMVALIFTQGSYQVLSIPSSAKALALSGSGSAYEDILPGNNPASVQNKESELSLYSAIYPGDILHSRFTIIKSIKEVAAFMDIQNINYGELEDGNSGYTFSANETLIKLGIKAIVFEKLSAGISGGYVYSQIESVKSQAWVMSLGFRIRSTDQRAGLGFSFENFGKVFDQYTVANETLPSRIRLSTYYQPVHFPGKLHLDIYQGKNIDPLQLSAGIELNLHSNVALRLSTSNSIQNLRDEFSAFHTGLGAGFKINFDQWDFEIGVRSLGTAGLVSGVSLTLNY